MSDEISLTKARYCRSILKTMSVNSDADAKRMCRGLTTERATDGASQMVAEAEAATLAAINALMIKIDVSGMPAASAEMTKARKAADRWVTLAG